MNALTKHENEFFSENEPYILHKHVILVKNIYDLFSEKIHFHVLSMRSIDKVTPREVISKERKLKNFFEKKSR